MGSTIARARRELATSRLPAAHRRVATRQRRGQHGAVAVEFGLLVPILLLLVFGMIDFGYMLNRDTMINNVSRDGARAASFGASHSQILARVNEDLAAYGIPTTSPTTTVAIDCTTADGTPCDASSVTYDTLAESGGAASITITYRHPWITPLTGALFGDDFELEKRTKMRIE